MVIVGLTGSLATGKSTVATMFRELGAKVVDADKITHHLIRPGKNCFKQVVRYFGNAILVKGHIDRKKLAKIVFSNGFALKKLEAIIHPKVICEIKKEIAVAKRLQRRKIIVIDAPLLIEAGLHSLVDVLIVVKANLGQQITRVILRKGITREGALHRIKSQMPLRQKTQLADIIIANTGDLHSTRKQVQTIWFKLLKIQNN